MYDVFMSGKNLYSEIASKSFHTTYEECLEHFKKGTPIKKKGDKWYYGTQDDYDKLADGEDDTYDDGKDRRTAAKSILLGVLYGRGETSIAEQLGCSVEEAHKIKSDVFDNFPAIKKFEQDSIKMASELGYVTTICGRKRRLPSMMLPDYEVRWSKSRKNLDPLDFENEEEEVPIDIQEKWLRKLKTSKYKKAIFEQANKEGLWIVDHTREKDVTKVVNARIQGSAAELTKAAMIQLHNNKRLKELGFRILIPIHDEVLCECPEENAKECKELLASIMSKAAEDILKMPISCDVACSRVWYGEPVKV